MCWLRDGLILGVVTRGVVVREVVVVHSVEGRMSRFLKRKDGWGKTANIGDAYDGRTESTPSHSVIERE